MFSGQGAQSQVCSGGLDMCSNTLGVAAALSSPCCNVEAVLCQFLSMLPQWTPGLAVHLLEVAS